ncbi:MAG: hypothetical protein AUJ60_09685 [Nitrospirae bacterium CG1_02_44_142]|nr:MAG: hypothetical protein AUJ60_09685 [Nitrospirae bacterium CG1_02_44_142]
MQRHSIFIREKIIGPHLTLSAGSFWLDSKFRILDFIPGKKIYFRTGEKQWELILHIILTRLKGNGRTASWSARVQREDAMSFKEKGQRAEKS